MASATDNPNVSCTLSTRETATSAAARAANFWDSEAGSAPPSCKKLRWGHNFRICLNVLLVVKCRLVQLNQIKRSVKLLGQPI